MSFHNLLRAARNASRGKSRLANVARFGFDLEHQLVQIHDELVSRTYQPGSYRTFEIFEPKRRMISAAPFRDRVVHHALCNVLEPIFERTFVFDSYACRRGKGTHAAVDRFQTFARKHRYVLKCDLRKFFPSVDHQILKEVVAHKIKDHDVRWLVDRIIDNSNPQEPIDCCFPGDDLVTVAERRRGMPIGNQTSQFFANVLLNPFDHFVRDHLRVAGYVRYVDDFAIFGDSAAELSQLRDRCRQFLATLRLRLHPQKSVVSRTINGTRFLGYRVFPTHRRLPATNLILLRRRLRQMQKDYARGIVDLASVRRRLVSWIGHASHAETSQLRTDLLGGILFTRSSGE